MVLFLDYEKILISIWCSQATNTQEPDTLIRYEFDYKMISQVRFNRDSMRKKFLVNIWIRTHSLHLFSMGISLLTGICNTPDGHFAPIGSQNPGVPTWYITIM